MNPLPYLQLSGSVFEWSSSDPSLKCDVSADFGGLDLSLIAPDPATPATNPSVHADLTFASDLSDSRRRGELGDTELANLVSKLNTGAVYQASFTLAHSTKPNYFFQNAWQLRIVGKFWVRDNAVPNEAPFELPLIATVNLPLLVIDEMLSMT